MKPVEWQFFHLAKTGCALEAVKKPFNNEGLWVIEGARTPDPQNHNLML